MAGIALGKVSIAGLESLIHEIDVSTIEFAIIKLDGHLDRFGDVFGDIESVVNGLACTGGNLMVVKGNENILRVSSSDAVTIFVDDKVIDKVGPLIDRSVFGSTTADPDDSIAGFCLDLQPQFVRIDRPLGQVVSDFQGSDHGFEQVSLAGLQCRNFWPQRCDQLPFEAPLFPDPKDVDPRTVFKNRLGFLDHLVVPSPERQSGIATGKIVIMDHVFACFGMRLGSKVIGFLERHMATVAVGLRFFRIVKASSAVPCNSA